MSSKMYEANGYNQDLDLLIISHQLKCVCVCVCVISYKKWVQREKHQNNERGEPTTSYIWAGWVWEVIEWTLETLGSWPIMPKNLRRQCIQITPIYLKGHFTHDSESPYLVHSKHSHWWKRRSWSKFASHYTWGPNKVCECKMDITSTWIPTGASNGSCFTITWITFQNHLLEVGITQNQETMAFRTLTTVELFYYVMRENLHE
jgi:hypothetical protein